MADKNKKSFLYNLLGLFRESSKLKEALRFILVGVLATIIHYAIYYFLLAFIDLNIAYTIGYILSFIANFFMSNYFTFKTKPTFIKSIGFGLSHLINYFLHIILLNTFVSLVGLREEIAPVFVFAIAIPVNFL